MKAVAQLRLAMLFLVSRHLTHLLCLSFGQLQLQTGIPKQFRRFTPHSHRRNSVKSWLPARFSSRAAATAAAIACAIPTATPARTAAAATVSAATAGSSGLSRSGFVYIDCTAIHFASVQGLDGVAGFSAVCHFDKCEAAGLTSIAVTYNRNPFYCAIFGKSGF